MTPKPAKRIACTLIQYMAPAFRAFAPQTGGFPTTKLFGELIL